MLKHKYPPKKDPNRKIGQSYSLKTLDLAANKDANKHRDETNEQKLDRLKTLRKRRMAQIKGLQKNIDNLLKDKEKVKGDIRKEGKIDAELRVAQTATGVLSKNLEKIEEEIQQTERYLFKVDDFINDLIK